MNHQSRTHWLAIVSLIFFGAQAKAGLIPVSTTVTPDGSNYRYSYSIDLSSDSSLQKGDFFTIVDFNGLVSGKNAQPANFTFSSSNTGGLPIGTTATDSASIPNATWTYNGPTITTPGSLGIFSLDSTLPAATSTSAFAAQTHRNIGGQVDSNITQISSPGAGAPPGVPEPAAVLLTAIGIPCVILLRVFRVSHI